jgi:hypothetical protein
MKLYLSNELSDIRDEMDDVKKETSDGVIFKEGDGPASITLGGVKKGTVLEGKTIREVLLDMLCPFVYPSAVATLELSPHCNYLSRIGNAVEIKGVTVDINKGSLPISRVIFKQKKGSRYETIGAYDSMTTEHWFPEILEITQSISSDHFIVEIYDTEGNSCTVNTQAVDIVYPIFYGTMDGNVEPTTELIENMYELLKYSGTDCSLRYTTSNQSMVFAIPQGYGVVSDIFDQNGYIITKSFKTKTLTLSFEVKEKSGDIIKTNIYKQNYFVYYNNPSTVTGFEITYKF